MKNPGFFFEKNAKMQKIEKKAAGGPPGSDFWLKNWKKGDRPPPSPTVPRQFPDSSRHFGTKMGPNGPRWVPMGPKPSQILRKPSKTFKNLPKPSKNLQNLRNFEKFETSTDFHENWSIFFLFWVLISNLGSKPLMGPKWAHWGPMGPKCPCRGKCGFSQVEFD